MTRIEDRLRRELLELADVLAAVEEPAASAVAVDRAAAARPSRRRLLQASAAAGFAIVLTGGLLVLARRDDELEDVPAPANRRPNGSGRWRLLPPPPIEPRAYAATAWSGTEAVFWAGSNTERTFAYGDGAAYDPSTDSWRTIPVPGWGHPGLAATWFDGAFYAAAKGGGTRFDPLAGEWADLPPVDAMLLARLIATDDAVFAVGRGTSVDDDVVIQRYDVDGGVWDTGSRFVTNAATDAVVDGLDRLETDVLWTGREVVLWQTMVGIAFDPVSKDWRVIGTYEIASLQIDTSRTVATDAGVVIASSGTSSSTGRLMHIGVLDDQGRQQRRVPLPAESLDNVSLAAAGAWAVAFIEGGRPFGYHAPSGTGLSLVGAPDIGAEPNTVWTGEELIVWGDASSVAAAWTPPTG